MEISSDPTEQSANVVSSVPNSMDEISTTLPRNSALSVDLLGLNEFQQYGHLISKLQIHIKKIIALVMSIFTNIFNPHFFYHSYGHVPHVKHNPQRKVLVSSTLIALFLIV